jgi:hypothetical protein
MHGKTLRNWRSKRAGGHMTIYGDDVGERTHTKITRVSSITPGTAAQKCCYATDTFGTVHTLLLN